MRRDAEARERGPVLFRAVACVAFPAIARMRPGQIGHQPVARYLGDDRGGGDGEAPAVALHHGVGRTAEPGRDVAVDQCTGRRHGQGRDCPLHRQQGRAENVEAVDFRHVGNADPHVRMFVDRAEQRLADGAGQFLGVVDPAGEGGGQPVGVKYRCRRDDRPGPRAAARFVYSGDVPA